MPNELIEYRLKCERNGWKDTAIVRCPEDWSDEYIAELAKEYNAVVVEGGVVNGNRICHLRVPVVRPKTVLQECIELLRKNRAIQDKAWAEYEANKQKGISEGPVAEN